MEEIRISKTALDSTLHEIKMKLWSISGSSQEAERSIEPLVWYICTGRAPTPFLIALINANKRKITTISKRLHKIGGWNTDDAVKSVKSALLQ